LNTDLSLAIGGITALIRSRCVALSRVVDWHRPFVHNGDGHDILVDLVDSPRQGRRHADKIPAADVDRLGQHLQRQLEWEGRLVPGQGSETALQPVLEVVGQCWDLDRFRRAWDALASEPERYVLLELYGKSLLFLDRQENAASIFFPGASSLVGVALSGVLFRHLQLIFALLMGNFAGLMLHAAGVVKEGRGYAFVGPSGSGKTTLASSMEGDALVLADDGVEQLRQQRDPGCTIAPCRILVSGQAGPDGALAGIRRHCHAVGQCTAAPQGVQRCRLGESVGVGSRPVWYSALL
jgi:hypothetical protein